MSEPVNHDAGEPPASQSVAAPTGERRSEAGEERREGLNEGGAERREGLNDGGAERRHGNPRGRGKGRQRQGDKPRRRDVNGWVVLDKGVGMTSTQAVAVIKRALNAKKAGHAGTLDPLASGILPIALGEATKTVPFIMDGRKAYVFTVTWGVETDTDDAEGRVVGRTDIMPEREAVEALLPRFTGEIMQTPPQ